MMLQKWFGYRFLAEDDGGGDGGLEETSTATKGTPAEGSGEDGEKTLPASTEAKDMVDNLSSTTAKQGAAPEDADAPKWLSQLDKARREDKRYESLKGFKTIGDLADQYVDIKDRAVIFPKKDSPQEEMEGFLKKMDIPYGKDAKYDLVTDKALAGNKMVDAIRDRFAKTALASALNRKQAQALWENLQATMIASGEVVKGQILAKQKTFPARMEATYQKEYQVDAERKGAIQADLNRVKAFLHDTGLAKPFQESGILLDPAVVRAIARHEQKIGASAGGIQSSQAGGASGEQEDLVYSNEFKKRYGR